MATYLTRTPNSSGSNTTWTFSCWYKKTSIGLDTVPFATGYTSPQIDEAMINIGADDQLRFNIAINDVTDVTVKSARKLRDTSGFYHIVVACDTTQATASDRIKIYFNGELETNLSNTDYPTQNQSTFFGDTNKTQEIGRQPRSSNYLFGVMSHVHFIDGTAYQASDFGQYDANGVWKIKTSPSVTYGTNGFFILKDGGSVTDQSGNGNNWTVSGGTLTDTLDCSANVFATWNSLSGSASNTYSNGNTTVSYPNNFQRNANGTLAFNSGKYYGEFKRTGAANLHIGIVGNTFLEDGRIITDTGESHTYNMRGHTGCVTLITNTGDQSIFVDGSDSSTDVDFFTSAGDIVMVAFDADTKKIWFGKNGTWSSSGNPATGANPSYTYSGTATSDFTFGADTENGSSCNANFGNGYFGTTAVASAGTNASGNGIFEYDVPTGYTALSTKGLNL